LAVNTGQPLLPIVRIKFASFLSGVPETLRWHYMKAKSLDRKFDDNKEEILDEFD